MKAKRLIAAAAVAGAAAPVVAAAVTPPALDLALRVADASGYAERLSPPPAQPDWTELLMQASAWELLGLALAGATLIAAALLGLRRSRYWPSRTPRVEGSAWRDRAAADLEREARRRRAFELGERLIAAQGVLPKADAARSVQPAPPSPAFGSHDRQLAPPHAVDAPRKAAAEAQPSQQARPSEDAPSLPEAQAKLDARIRAIAKRQTEARHAREGRGASA